MFLPMHSLHSIDQRSISEEAMERKTSGDSNSWKEAVKKSKKRRSKLKKIRDNPKLLIESLKEGDKWMRQDAARELGKFKDTQSLQALIFALNDRLPSVTEFAAQTLGYYEDSNAIEPLIQAMKNGGSALRSTCIEALANIGSKKAIEALIMNMMESAMIREHTIYALEYRDVKSLGNHYDLEAMKPLIDALNDEDYAKRESAAYVLGLLQDSKALEPLIAILEDEKTSVREAAVLALGKLGDSKAVEPLLKRLEVESQYAISAVIEVLGQLLDSRAIEPLLTILRDNNRNERVRLQTIKSLEGFKDSRVTESLITVLNEKNRVIKEKVIEVLGEYEDKKSIDSLLRIAMHDYDYDLRFKAEESLEKLRDKHALEKLSNYKRDQERLYLDLRRRLEKLSKVEDSVKRSMGKILTSFIQKNKFLELAEILYNFIIEEEMEIEKRYGKYREIRDLFIEIDNPFANFILNIFESRYGNDLGSKFWRATKNGQ